MSKTPNHGTTPRSKIRTSNTLPSPMIHHPISQETPLRSTLLPRLIEFHDEYQDFESNMVSLGTVAENLRNFNESFSAFMYGLQINAYTVDFAKIPDYINPEYIEHNKEVLKKIEQAEKELQDLNQHSTSYQNEEPEEILSDDDFFEMQPSSKNIQRHPLPRTRTNPPVGTRNPSNGNTGRRSFLPMRTNSTLGSQEQRGTATASTSSSRRRITQATSSIGSASRVTSKYRQQDSRYGGSSLNSSSNDSSRPSSSSSRSMANYGRVQKPKNNNKSSASSINNRPPFR